MTLNDFLTTLTGFDGDAMLVFTTADGPINAGYHVTEFKLHFVTSIDCGGQQSQWTEAALQLLDGYGGVHMPVKKFIAIGDQSVARIPDLGTAPLQVEFAAGNHGKRIYQITDVRAEEDQVIAHLGDISAFCKPMAQSKSVAAANSTGSADKGDCCGNTTAETAAQSCCGPTSAQPTASGCCA